MDVTQLSSKYQVRILTEKDIDGIYELFLGNPMYFQYCPPAATRESIAKDMKALPSGKTEEDKYYIGIFDGDTLIAVMDLILNYPNADTAFIGLFMMESKYQGKGIGTSVISDAIACLHKNGYQYTRLGYVKGNPQSRAFWLKNKFCETGLEIEQEDYTVVVLQRDNGRQ